MPPVGRGDFLVAHWEGRLSCRPLGGRLSCRPLGGATFLSPVGRGDFLVAHWGGGFLAAHSIGSGAGDCAPAPSHTTGRTVFSIRRLESPEALSSLVQGLSFRFPPPLRLDLRPSGLPGSTLGPSVPGPGRPPRPAVGASCDPAAESTIGPVRLLRSFAPPALPGFFATMTSADFSQALTLEISPSKVLPLSPRAARLYLMPSGWDSGFAVPRQLTARTRPRCRFVFLRSWVCLPLPPASPRGYALRFG